VDLNKPNFGIWTTMMLWTLYGYGSLSYKKS